MKGLRRSLENAGFHVTEKNIEYKDLLGERLVEKRITGYYTSKNIKISYVSKNNKKDLFITIHGNKANQDTADKLEKLGGIVDYNKEDKRIFAVFKNIKEEKAIEIVRKMFTSRIT